jgi:antitoxin YefM
VWICENPVVVAAAGTTGGRRAEFGYHDDFDWGGVRIACAVRHRMNWRPWWYDHQAYETALSEAHCDASTSSRTSKPAAVRSQPSAETLRYPNPVPVWYHKLVPHRRERVAVAISASEARSRLFPLIQQVNDDHVPVRISSKGGDAVLISAEDFDSWQETIYLLRSPANARRLMEAVARDKSGEAAVVKTMEELEALAGE